MIFWCIRTLLPRNYFSPLLYTPYQYHNIQNGSPTALISEDSDNVSANILSTS